MRGSLEIKVLSARRRRWIDFCRRRLFYRDFTEEKQNDGRGSDKAGAGARDGARAGGRRGFVGAYGDAFADWGGDLFAGWRERADIVPG